MVSEIEQLPDLTRFLKPIVPRPTSRKLRLSELPALQFSGRVLRVSAVP